jgi:SAM-dependent methyltransferase
MSEDELDNFYEQEYRQLYQGSEGPNPKDLIVQQSRAESLLAFIKIKLAYCSRHLDIGCSAGLLMQFFQQYYDCQSVGIEPGAAYRDYARKHGLTVYGSLNELQTAEESRFDLISMAHVLEHISDPVAYLISLRETLLEEDGHLLVEVPNLYAHDSFEVAHLASYSAHTLTQTLQKAGFDIIDLKQHGKPRSKILPLYLTANARLATDPGSFHLQPESTVKRKRQLGMLRRRLLSKLAPRRAWIPTEQLII